ncbi:hypothetical protein PoB_001506800 [Plakobranchus ocellatus]|uniref:Uncharacterized protein n=1 Tax=Plakobranchus ocellatus TaxID=259542 RepID=A0AAV3Z1B4_9GAST|nr:hypothetical protein PoB_001506800 [Plakobranchus ocellatus]
MVIKILLAFENFEYSDVRLVLLLLLMRGVWEGKGNMLEESFTSENYACAWLDVRMTSSLALYYYQLFNTTGAATSKIELIVIW